jgi:3-dehydroquinate synthase
MIAAARIADKLYDFPASDRARIERLLEAVGLPVHIPEFIGTEGVLARLKWDKKRSGAIINFVLVKKIGMPFVTAAVTETIIREVIEGLKN